MTLYDLTAEFLDLANRLADEPDAVDLDAIEANESALRDKAGSYVAVWRQLDAEAEVMRAEARRLSEAATKRENGSRRLRDRLCWCLDTLGIKGLPTPMGRLSVSNASRPSIRWRGALEDIPEQFKKIEIKWHDAAVLAAFKAGTLPEGFEAKVTRFVRVT